MRACNICGSNGSHVWIFMLIHSGNPIWSQIQGWVSDFYGPVEKIACFSTHQEMNPNAVSVYPLEPPSISIAASRTKTGVFGEEVCWYSRLSRRSGANALINMAMAMLSSSLPVLANYGKESSRFEACQSFSLFRYVRSLCWWGMTQSFHRKARVYPSPKSSDLICMLSWHSTLTLSTKRLLKLLINLRPRIHWY